jgi:hypothetical protein
LSHESHEQGGQVSTESPQTTNKGRGTTAGRKSAYFWGAASGVVFALFAPILRPAARSAVKGGIRVGRYAKKVASNIKEEFEDIASEAQADLNSEGKGDQTKTN